MVAAAVFAPLHFFAAAPKLERYAQASGVFVEDAKVELHDVPADDRVGVVAGKPFVEFFQQHGSRVAVFKLEIHRAGVTIGRPEHVHLAFAAAFQGNGIQLALFGGLDIQRDQPQVGPVFRVGFHLRVEQQALRIGRPTKDHWRGDEPFHHVALGRANVALEHLDAGLAQRGFQAHQLTVLLAIQAEHRTMLEIQQGQGL